MIKKSNINDKREELEFVKEYDIVINFINELFEGFIIKLSNDFSSILFANRHENFLVTFNGENKKKKKITVVGDN